METFIWIFFGVLALILFVFAGLSCRQMCTASEISRHGKRITVFVLLLAILLVILGAILLLFAFHA